MSSRAIESDPLAMNFVVRKIFSLDFALNDESDSLISGSSHDVSDEFSLFCSGKLSESCSRNDKEELEGHSIGIFAVIC